MSKRTEHSTQLLRRWLRGETNRREEAELERLAQDDPFLAGALEGYRKVPAGEHTQRLTQLRRRLGGDSRRGSLLLWSRLAAAVALLVVAAGVWWWTQSSPQEVVADLTPAAEVAPSARPRENIAGREESERPASPASAPAVTQDRPATTADTAEPSTGGAGRGDRPGRARVAIAADSEATQEPEETYAEAATEEAPTTATGLALTADTAFADEIAEPATDEVFDGVALAPPSPTPQRATPPPARRQVPSSAPQPDQLRDYQISNSGAPVAYAGQRLIQGTVTDEEGYPLIGANVLEIGTNNGTVTDFDGFFQLAVDSSQQYLLVSYLGYEPRQANIPAEGTLAVVLDEGSDVLDEVVVTGYSQQLEKTDDNDYLPVNARPINGFRELRNYLDMRIPPQTGRGKVRLRFNVYPDGHLDDFEVIRSTNAALNSLAISLLRDGPRWEIISDGQEPVAKAYTVRFR
ncbi:MAG: carboxypeptidase-like regulatory domain-containing protein [Lewinella sp.]|nr:carboxypeptidase-like regulatory domain-containing protein [Lewinella sp.]